MVATAERMDAIYAGQRHIYDLTRKYFLLGRDRLIARLNVPDHGRALEVGCGTARNLITAARRYPTSEFYGLDISLEMLSTAREKIAAAGLSNRIVVVQADACDFDASALFGIDRFDRVFISYTLSMIPDWEAALQQGARVTGGAMSVVDFGQQEGLPRLFRMVLRNWLARFDVIPRAPLPDVLRALGDVNNMELDFERLYRDYAWAATLTRTDSDARAIQIECS